MNDCSNGSVTRFPTDAGAGSKVGLGRAAFCRKGRVRAIKTQRKMVETLIRLEPQTGSAVATYTFRSEPLRGLAG